MKIGSNDPIYMVTVTSIEKNLKEIQGFSLPIDQTIIRGEEVTNNSYHEIKTDFKVKVQ